jgi:hypothetical protein
MPPASVFAAALIESIKCHYAHSLSSVFEVFIYPYCQHRGLCRAHRRKEEVKRATGDVERPFWKKKINENEDIWRKATEMERKAERRASLIHGGPFTIIKLPEFAGFVPGTRARKLALPVGPPTPYSGSVHYGALAGGCPTQQLRKHQSSLAVQIWLRLGWGKALTDSRERPPLG